MDAYPDPGRGDLLAWALGVQVRGADVPERLEIRGHEWTVVWRTPRDFTWRSEKCWGLTIHGACEIHLCERLLKLPKKLAEVWVHELLHACFDLPNRGKKAKINLAQEEHFVTRVAPALAAALGVE